MNVCGVIESANYSVQYVNVDVNNVGFYHLNGTVAVSMVIYQQIDNAKLMLYRPHFD